MPTTPYTATVLEKTYVNSTTQPWDMFLYSEEPPASQVKVYGKTSLSVLVLIPQIAYIIIIDPNTPEEFTLLGLGAWPAPGVFTDIVIFRRVTGTYDPFAPGDFITAESINQRFNLLSLSTVDLTYYQTGTVLKYSPEAIVNHFDTAKGINKGMPTNEVELPYLGVNASHGATYTWGKTITNDDYPGDGDWAQFTLESPGNPTLPSFILELAKQCPETTSGATLVGVCAPIGTFPNQGETLQQFISVSLPYNANTLSSGARLIGLHISDGNAEGATNVQDYCDSLHFIGSGPNYLNSGSANIGYGGWDLPVLPGLNNIKSNTVAACLNRLNDPATSSQLSGAKHVKWWSPRGVSKTVQEGLERIANVYQTPWLQVNSTTYTTFGNIPAPFRDLSNIRKVVAETSKTPNYLEDAGTIWGGSRTMCGPFTDAEEQFIAPVFVVPPSGSFTFHATSVRKAAGDPPTWEAKSASSGVVSYIKLTFFLKPDF